MGQPAARISDMHTCPMVTGTVPHVGGPIVKGMPTVITCFMPQARVGDIATCVGPPDTIMKGSATVLVGGAPAARIGDMTMHGGVIVSGAPTVLIGDMGAGGGGGGMGGPGAFVEPVQQAKALVAAAKNGAPFCEVCTGADAGARASEPGGGAPQGGAGGAVPPAGKKSGKGGSTTVAVDDAKQEVTIRTKMEFTGPDASPEYAAAAKKQIEESWSGTMTRDGKPYKVNVVVDAKANKGGKPTAGYDQIIVDAKTNRMSQTLYGAGPGYQTPAAATDAARPRRIAHEYGHTLGLDDDYTDSPTGPKPKDPSKKNNIMAETWPDAKGKLPHPHQDHYEQVLKKHGH